jgi:fucose 4-O-acetylase-like acetyltransferase
VIGRPGAFRPREYFVKRTLGLLVPFLVWETIYGPGADKHPEMLSGISAFVGYYGHLLIDPHYEGRIWYLYVLWIALMLVGLVRLLGDRPGFLAASVPVVYAIGSVGQFNWLRWVYAFVVAGLLWRRYEQSILPRIRVLGAACAAAFVPIWLLVESGPELFARLAPALRPVSGADPVAVLLPVATIALGAVGVVAIVAASYRLPSRVETFLAGLGVSSLGIYVFHFFLIEMWRGMPAWFLPINALIALAGAWLLVRAVRLWAPAAAVLLGEVRMRRSAAPATALRAEAS